MTPQRNKRRERSSSEPETQQPLPKHDPNMPSSSPFVYPPGLRFVPTDEELILYYLKPFSQDNKIPWPNLHVHRANIYESNPQQLSEKYEKGNLKEWFFISERTKINKDGKKQKRSDLGGYWHATGAKKKTNDVGGVVSYKTALCYYVGKQPNGVKSNWLMQEYCIDSSHDNKTVDYALCKIYLRPMAKNKQKEGGVEAEAEEEEVVQPRNIENQQQQPQPQFCPIPTSLVSDQPQPQPQPQQQPFYDISDYQQSHETQRRDIGYNVENQQLQPQPQFCPTPTSLVSDQLQPQPQPQLQQELFYDISDYQHPQSWPDELDSHETQRRDIGYNVENPQPQFCPTPTSLVSDQPQPQPQPQPQQQPFDDISDYQQPRFWPDELDSYKTQRRDIGYNEPHQSQNFDTTDHQLQPWQARLESNQTQPDDVAHHQPYQQQQPLDTIDHQQSRQLQFLQAKIDSTQMELDDVVDHQPYQPQPLGTDDQQQAPELQFWQAMLDSNPTQPDHDIAYYQPEQPQPLDTFQYQIQRSWPAPLDSHQSHFHDVQYHPSQPHQPPHQSQIFPSPLDSDQPQPHRHRDGNSIDSGESNNRS